MSRRRLLFLGLSGGSSDNDDTGGDGYVDPGDTSIYGRAGDMVVYNNSESRLMLVPYGDELDSSWTPIGIVAVPGHHDIYGDGSCGVVSCYVVNASDPDGCFGSEFSSSTTNIVVTPCTKTLIGSTLIKKRTTVLGGAVSALTSFQKAAQALYNSEDGPNQSILALPDDVASDWGRTNHDLLIDLADETYSNWRHGNTTNYMQSNSFPGMAMGCELFSTPGTNSGDWYFMGGLEMLYITAMFPKIYTESFQAIKKCYTTAPIRYYLGFGTACSTPVTPNASTTTCWVGMLNPSMGFVYNYLYNYGNASTNTNGYAYVNPFIQLSFDGYY